MSKVALFFPGQGAQFVGMGKELHEAFGEVREIYEEASDALGKDMARLSFEGPEEELRRSVNTQPAVLIHGVACLRLLRQAGIDGEAAAGHSLGEYSAHVAAGSLGFVDAARIVHRRGELMYEAGLRRPGTMAALIGLDPARLPGLIDEAGTVGIVTAANLNSPRQVVISGEIAAVERAVELAREAGAKRALPLKVSGAFHSPLMESAAEGLATVLDATDIERASWPVVANCTAQPVVEVDDIRQTLKDQVLEQVRWEETVRWFVAAGFETAVELGPGTVLRGLARDIDRSITVHSVGTPADLDRVAAILATA
jgi:[acyl-carrier-protein] S-malonyltransferase